MALARELGFYAIKMHGSAYSLKGIPDNLLLKDGRAFWIEFKRPGEEPTKIQLKRMAELAAVGCAVAVCTSAQEVHEFLTTVSTA